MNSTTWERPEWVSTPMALVDRLHLPSQNDAYLSAIPETDISDLVDRPDVP